MPELKRLRSGQWLSLDKSKQICHSADMYVDNSSPIFVLVHLGHKYPEHLTECVDQIQLFSPTAKIILIIDNKTIEYRCSFINGLTTYFAKSTEVNDKVINKLGQGLFSYALLRFFVLHDCMTKLNIVQCIHMEHDNMLYVNGQYLWNKFSKTCGTKLGITRDSNTRCIAGLMWIGSQEALQKLNEHFVSSNFSNNEMYLLCEFLMHSPLAKTIPVVPANFKNNYRLEDRDNYDMCFDAAAAGQFIGGIDPIHDPGDTRGFVNETAIYKFGKTPQCVQFFWGLDNMNRRIPFIKHKQLIVRLCNLHIHSKRLQLFVSCPWSNIGDIIQGYRFKDLADIQFHSDEDFEQKIGPKHKTVYVKTDKLEHWQASIFPHIKHNFTLITHNADHCVDETYKPILNSPLLLKWYGQNVRIDHPKVVEIPIGLANPEWPHGNINTFSTVCREHHFKRNKIYLNFGKTASAREKFRQKLIDQPCVHKEEHLLKYPQYCKTMAEFQVIATPEGNGPDTHRFWEALYLGSAVIRDKRKTIFKDVKIPQFNWNTGLKSAFSTYESWKFWKGRPECRFSHYKAMIYRPVKQPKAYKPFDIVIICHPKDFIMLPNVIRAIQTCTINHQNTIVVSPFAKHPGSKAKLAKLIPDNITLVDEETLTLFTFGDIQKLMGEHTERTGWYYQQLLKLHADHFSKADNILILDADTLFAKHVTFWDPEDGAQLFNLVDKDEYYYRDHVQRLFEELGIEQEKSDQKKPKSAVCHHMMFDVPMLKQLRNKSKYRPFWQAFMKHVDKDLLPGSGASEYEIYYQFVKSEGRAKIRPLSFIEPNDRRIAYNNLKWKHHDFVTVHAWTVN